MKEKEDWRTTDRRIKALLQIQQKLRVKMNENIGNPDFDLYMRAHKVASNLCWDLLGSR